MTDGALTGPARPLRVDQFVPSFVLHDAISNHVRQVQRILRDAGYLSDVYFEHLDPRLEGRARSYRECDPTPDAHRVLLYHASTHSEMAGWLIDAARGGQRVAIDYHNITPSEYFARWEPIAARSMELARRQLAEILPWVGLAVADSAYNASELEALGHAGAAVRPLLLDLSEFHQQPDPATAARLADARRSGPLWLFVGRLAPNKCQHDVIAAFAVFRRLFAPGARLALVGGATSVRYVSSLRSMTDRLGLGDSVEFAGSLRFAEMLAYFRAADAFVCLSEHEGFCVPLIEAMEAGTPVVAHRSSAVTETVASAGILLDDKDPLSVACAVQALIDDPARRTAAVGAGRRRAQAFALERTTSMWLQQFGGPAPAGSTI